MANMRDVHKRILSLPLDAEASVKLKRLAKSQGKTMTALAAEILEEKASYLPFFDEDQAEVDAIIDRNRAKREKMKRAEAPMVFK